MFALTNLLVHRTSGNWSDSFEIKLTDKYQKPVYKKVGGKHGADYQLLYGTTVMHGSNKAEHFMLGLGSKTNKEYTVSLHDVGSKSLGLIFGPETPNKTFSLFCKKK